MGLSCSALENLEKNAALQRFCGTEVLSPNDPIWNTLFSHYISPSFNQADDCLLESSMEELKAQLITNNPQTRNFSALIKVFTARAFELKSSVQTADSMFLWQTYNSMFMIRNIFKIFASSLSDDLVAQQLMSTPPTDGSGDQNQKEGNPHEMLLAALLHIVTELEMTRTTYMLHLEAVNILIVCLSSQMFISKPSPKLSSYKLLTKSGSSAPITEALINNFINQEEPPQPVVGKDDYGSFVVGMANGIWNMLKKSVFGKEDKDMADLKEQSLASHSLYLLLILINHCPDIEIGNEVNPYREDFSNFGNITATNGNDEPPASVLSFVSFRVNYSKLYEVVCSQINKDSTTLLLYALVHRNNSFKSYIMARSDIELLVLPILQTLYNSPTSASRHIYMSLIVILILSEEDLFNQQVHDIKVNNIVWYTERNITELSLGGLIILVVIRTIHYNILRSRDKYLHTNCLATLANMSSKFRTLHSYVAQRLISLFETLAKRQMKLSDRVQNNDPLDADHDEAIQDLKVLEEVLRMILEIYNSTLVYQLPQNRHFVYSLLYKKELFESYARFPATQDLVFNLDVVIAYFTKWLGEEHGDLSVREVMDRIQEGILHWKPDILRKFPELKFKYVEEDKHEEFFVPYVWCIIFRKAGIYWSPGQLSLFDVATDLD